MLLPGCGVSGAVNNEETVTFKSRESKKEENRNKNVRLRGEKKARERWRLKGTERNNVENPPQISQSQKIADPKITENSKI